MRVIAGTLKGRRLRGPSWEGLRPTSGKLRGTLFNLLASRVVGARVLDAYAGTGALGIEALSRGARSATFIEADRRARSLIAQNVAICRVENVCVIIPAKVGPALETLRAASSHAPFDIVLLDPPYAPGEKLDAVLAAAEGVLARGGIAVLEHARRRQVPEAAGRLRLVREVVAGDAALAFYEVSQHA